MLAGSREHVRARAEPTRPSYPRKRTRRPEGLQDHTSELWCEVGPYPAFDVVPCSERQGKVIHRERGSGSEIKTREEGT